MGLAYFYGGSMADTKYISLTGLSRFLSKLKITFASKDHAHDLATNHSPGFMSTTDKMNLTNAMDDITNIKEGKILVKELTLEASNWVETSSEILPYEFIYNNDSILQDDIFNIYFDDKSILEASNCFIIVKANSGAGNITFLAKKIPSLDLTISEIRYVR